MLEELLTSSGASTLFKTPPFLSTYGSSAHSSALGLFCCMSNGANEDEMSL